MNENFCSLPWTGIDISPQGQFKPCCKYSQNIATDIKSYISSDHLKELQQKFLNGEKPAGCKRCWDDESSGLPSKRQIDRIYSFNGQDPSLDSWKILSMSFGNTCNLACVTCNSLSSSRWAIDEKKLHNNSKFLDRKIYIHKQFYRDNGFMSDLLDRCQDLIHVDIPGGEPFFADKDIHKRFLRSLSHPEKIKIHYTTNGTVFPDEEFWDIWKKFRHIDIQISIDGIGEKFEYLRYPAKWQTVQENVRRYQEYSDCIQISISHTVSWLNILDLQNFIDWCRDNNLPDPYIGMVSNPDYLNVKSLPIGIKKMIRESFDDTAHHEVIKSLEYMDSEDLQMFFDKGRDWITSLDLIRKTNFSNIFPEINRFIQNN